MTNEERRQEYARKLAYDAGFSKGCVDGGIGCKPCPSDLYDARPGYAEGYKDGWEAGQGWREDEEK
jgi:hypothetical protein